jgi:hypothetical protein
VIIDLLNNTERKAKEYFLQILGVARLGYLPLEVNSPRVPTKGLLIRKVKYFRELALRANLFSRLEEVISIDLEELL